MALVSSAVLLAGVAGCGGDDSDPSSEGGSPDPQPAFYLTAPDLAGLKRQARAAGERFAKSQKPGPSLLVLDFGAARLKGDTYGSAFRDGTFFSNEEIGAALEAAARGYRDGYRHGSVTIVYANSNAHLGRPGKGYKPFDEQVAREAGEQQAETVRRLKLFPHQTAAAGGDIEPGYDAVAKPEVAIALVAGAVAGSDGGPYFNFGTAPCVNGKCGNGWTVEDICEVVTGGGRVALPEIYFTERIDQPAQWAEVEKTCDIDRFAGVSASPAGELSPADAWRTLKEKTSAELDPVIVVFPE